MGAQTVITNWLPSGNELTRDSGPSVIFSGKRRVSSDSHVRIIILIVFYFSSFSDDGHQDHPEQTSWLRESEMNVDEVEGEDKIACLFHLFQVVYYKSVHFWSISESSSLDCFLNPSPKNCSFKWESNECSLFLSCKILFATLDVGFFYYFYIFYCFWTTRFEV